MPILPVSRSSDVSRKKQAAGSFPSSADVGVVNPRITRDQGVNVPMVNAPEGAFQSIGTQTGQLVPGLENLELVAIKQRNREDTVARSDAINNYAKITGDELSRLNVEEDLSNPDVLQKYGEFLASKRNELLSGHRGSRDSITSLTTRLGEVEAELIGKAAAVSTKIGSGKIKTLYNNSLAPLGDKASQDPSMKNIDQQFLNLETVVNDLMPALELGEEENFINVGREHITLSALNSLIASGRIEQADALMGNTGVYLSPETQREVRNRIQTSRYSKDQTLLKINELETRIGRPLTQTELLSAYGISTQDDKLSKAAELKQEISAIEEVMGRPLSEEEKLRKFGVAPAETKITEKDKEIQGYIDRGYSPELAADIANGQIKVVGPDDFGNIFTVNAVTNETRPVSEADKDIILTELQGSEGENVQEQEVQPDQTGQASLGEAVEKGMGPVAKIQTGISNIYGPFQEGTVFEDTTDARTQIRTFNQLVKRAFVNNDKFPIAEQETVQKFLPDPDLWFQDPDTARSNLGSLQDSLIKFKTAKEKELNKKGITTKRKSDLADQVSTIDEVLSLMESPEIKAEEMPEGIPQGSQKIGTSRNGNPVYTTPEGKRLEVIQGESQ